MDPTQVFLPGAQSLVTAILTDTWAQARTAIAKLCSRRYPATSAERTGHELDAARHQALELAAGGSEADRAARMQLFWAGYLAGQAAARPELATVFAELPALLGAGQPTTQVSTVHNTISGTVTGNAVQAGDIHGDINFGR
jgi:hypothetical protein